MLKIGQAAPVFTLPDADMELFSLDSLRGKKHAVLFFYPRDDMPVCTREAVAFSDHESTFIRLGCEVLGISRDDCLSHAEFRDKHGLTVRLLADDEGKVCRQYGLCQVKEKEGVQKVCVTCATFIIDRQGILRHVLHNTMHGGHVEEVLDLVKQLEKPCKL